MQDYSSQAPPLTARRSILMATLCLVSLSALVSRTSMANRPAVRSDLIESETLDARFGSTADAAAFEAALQQTGNEPFDIPQDSDWVTLKVKSGQTISALIESQGMFKYEWMELMELGADVKRLRNLKVGEEIQLRKNAENKLDELVYEIDEARTLQIRRVDDKLQAMVLTTELERRSADAHGVIANSLFADGAKAGLSNSLMNDMAEIFGYDIDFAQDLRDGDHFSVVYEQLYKNGEKVRDGNIIAAEFVNRGQSHRAMRYVDKEGRAAYYALDGRSLRKAFMRTPVDFARISSGFNLRRRHPILNIIRAHKGVDYAAGTGTPVKASGDGRVQFIGNKSGYGRVIVLQHGNQYTTLYGHLSRFRPNLRSGSKVSRGQVIGYVGKSGLATAPHLHYEFRVNGVHKDPKNVVLPRANGLTQQQIASWKAQNAAVVARLDALSGGSQVAAAAVPAGKARLTP